MAQLIQGIVDTQKNNRRSIGEVTAGDDLELELEVKMNGKPIEFINPECELLIKKSDNNRIRQTKDIIYQDGKFKIKVDEQGVTYPGIVTCQLLTREDGRVSTCLFYFMVGTSLDREVLQSISKVEVLEELDEYVATAFANLDEYEKRIISADETIRKLNDDMNEAEKIRGASELERQETFKDLKENMNATISNLESSINLSNLNEKERSEVFNSLKSDLESIKQDLNTLNTNITLEEGKRVQAEINRVNKALEIIEKLESTNNSVATAEAERVSEFNKIKTENNTLKEALTTINNTANSNEEVRKENETSRVEAEKARVNEFNTMKLENETFKQEINEQYEDIITKNTEFKEQMNTDFGNAKTDYFGEEHLNVVDRLNSDFDNVHQRINDASYLEYEGSNIKADNSYYGLTKDLSIKGRTLQNLLKTKPENTILNSSTHSGYMQPTFELSKKVYSFIFDVTTLDGAGAWYFIRGTGSNTPFGEYSRTHVTSIGKYILKVDLSEKDCYQILCGFSGEGSGSLENVILLEGDYTNTPLEELPFGEGIYSVGENEVTEEGKYKISWKSCGKNLINTRKLTPTGSNMASVEINEDIIKVSALTESGTHKYIKYEFDLKPTCKYTFTSKYTTSNSNANPRARIFASTTEDKAITTNGGNVTITTDSTGHVILYLYATFTNAVSTITEFKIQLEEGTVATEYEPYQESNFELLLDEPLRSLPNGVADEITEDGEEIRRVVKFIMNDETCKNVSVWHNTTASFNYIRFYIYYRQIPEGVIGVMNSSCLNDKYVAKGSPYGNEFESCNCVNDYIGVSIKVSEIPNFYDMTIVEKINAVREWLKENPITVYYQALEPIITKHNKNIKLKTFEGKTHITSDNYLRPTLSCKVPSNVQAVVSSLMLENEELNNTISVMSLKNEETELENIETNLDQDVRLTMLELGVM